MRGCSSSQDLNSDLWGIQWGVDVSPKETDGTDRELEWVSLGMVL